MSRELPAQLQFSEGSNSDDRYSSKWWTITMVKLRKLAKLEAKAEKKAIKKAIKKSKKKSKKADSKVDRSDVRSETPFSS
jgi:hypothetical protein